MTSPKLTETIMLSVPAEDGDGADRKSHPSLTMRRPRARHVKRVVVLLGADFMAKLFAAANQTTSGNIAAGEALARLSEPDCLNGLTEILADLCGVPVAVIDDLDPVDLFKVGQAMFGFFPDLATAFSS